MWKFNFRILPVCQSSEKVPMTRVQSTDVHCPSPNCVMCSCAAVLLSAIFSGQFKAPSSRVTHLIHPPYWVISWTITSILHSIRKYGSGGWNFVDTLNVKCYNENVQAFVYIIFAFILYFCPMPTVGGKKEWDEMEFLVRDIYPSILYNLTGNESIETQHQMFCSNFLWYPPKYKHLQFNE